MLIIITGIIAAEFGRFWHLVRRSLYSTLSPWFWASGAGPRWGLVVRVRKWEHLFLCGAFLRRAPKPAVAMDGRALRVRLREEVTSDYHFVAGPRS